MKLNKFYGYITLVALVFGFMTSYSVKLTQNVMGQDQSSEVQWEKRQEVQEKILEEQIKKEELQDQLLSLKKQLSELEKSMVLSEEKEGERMLEELDRLRIWGGIVPVIGRGVVIRLMEGSTLSKGETDLAMVGESHIRQIVNELFAAGAEAVSVNGQRLTTHSSIIYSGLTLLVNGGKVAAPFEIAAIGNPAILKTALEMHGGVLQQLRSNSQLEIQLETKNLVELPAYSGEYQVDQKM